MLARVRVHGRIVPVELRRHDRLWTARTTAAEDVAPQHAAALIGLGVDERQALAALAQALACATPDAVGRSGAAGLLTTGDRPLR